MFAFAERCYTSCVSAYLDFFSIYPVLTLVKMGSSLLINGNKLFRKVFKHLACIGNMQYLNKSQSFLNVGFIF